MKQTENSKEYGWDGWVLYMWVLWHLCTIFVDFVTDHSDLIVEGITFAALVPFLFVDIIYFSGQEELDLGINSNIFVAVGCLEVILDVLWRFVYGVATESIIQDVDLKQHVFERDLAFGVVVHLRIQEIEQFNVHM